MANNDEVHPNGDRRTPTNPEEISPRNAFGTYMGDSYAFDEVTDHEPELRITNTPTPSTRDTHKPTREQVNDHKGAADSITKEQEWIPTEKGITFVHQLGDTEQHRDQDTTATGDAPSHQTLKALAVFIITFIPILLILGIVFTTLAR